MRLTQYRRCDYVARMTREPRLETSAAVAVRAAGGQTALARLLGIAQSTVATWLRRKNELPPQYVLPVEKALGIPRHELRPDIYPVEEAVLSVPLARHTDGQPPALAPQCPQSEEAGGTNPDPLSGIAA